MNDVPFIKMHGAGNDYVFVDGFESRLPDNASELAIAVSNRNFGIGSDGLVLLIPSADDSADVEMRMWNADGSEGSMCGNAVRCVALWMNVCNRLAGPDYVSCRVKTKSRVVDVSTLELDLRAKSGQFCVDHGSPDFDINGELKHETLSDVFVAGGPFLAPLRFVALSMGNPHAVFVVDEITDQLVFGVGSVVEKHGRFADGTNVEWVRVINRQHIEVRVWERGSGETLACGSGACAAVVACVLQGLCDRGVNVLVDLPGGQLSVLWEESGSVHLTGPAQVSFTGVWSGRAR